MEITIFDKNTQREWTEYYSSYYLFRKRVNKLKYSNHLIIVSRDNMID